MSALPASRVYTGFWVDHSYGNMRGPTITVKTDVSNIVVALLSILVTLAGSWWWELVALAIYLVTWPGSKLSQAVVHQRRALLRNIISPGSFSMEALKGIYVYRSSRSFAAANFVVPLSLAVISSLGFLVAGVFTSQVVTSANIQVLTNSPTCGFINWTMMPVDGASGSSRLLSSLSEGAWQYSQRCYLPESLRPECNIFANSTIATPLITYDESPFISAQINGTRSITLDSGLIDSQTHLGLNTKNSDRVSVRMKTTCSVLDSDRYTRVVDRSTLNLTSVGADESLSPGTEYVWYFGPRTDDFGQQNGATFARNNWSVTYGNTYEFGALDYYSGATGDDGMASEWLPVEELRPPKGDVILIYVIPHGTLYLQPIDDPFFAAHQNETKAVLESAAGETSTGLRTLYASDRVASWMACRQQFQTCLITGECTELESFNDVFHKSPLLATSHVQSVVIDKLFSNMGTFIDLASLGSTTLQAGKQTNMLVAYLPPDQWETEVKGWFNFALSELQTITPFQAMGYDLALDGVETYIIPPATAEDRRLCHIQKMGAPIGFSNISVLGLSIVIGLSGFLFLLNMLLIPSAQLLDRHNVLALPKLRRWNQDGALHLQRKLYEVLGFDDWERATRTFPVYAGHESLPSLPDHLASAVPHAATPNVSPTITSQPNVSAAPAVNLPSMSQLDLTQSNTSSSPDDASSNSSDQGNRHSTIPSELQLNLTNSKTW